MALPSSCSKRAAADSAGVVVVREFVVVRTTLMVDSDKLEIRHWIRWLSTGAELAP